VSNLKPCPFCGAVPTKNPSGEYYAAHIEHADDCILITYFENDGLVWLMGDEVAAWNRREPDWQAKWEELVEIVATRTDQAKGEK
jgi:hypothetical protein